MLKNKLRIGAALWLAALTAAFCGCGVFPTGAELSKRLIVEAIGIDEADGVYTVTLQTLDTHSAGEGSDPNESGSVTRIFRFTGKTVAEALAGIPAATGLTPLYSQARILVLGKSAAEENVRAALDFFLREYHTRSDILLATAGQSAEEIVRADLGSSAPDALILEDAILRAAEKGEACAVKLYRFMNLMYTETDTPFCPVVELRASAEEDLQEPVLGRTAFFEDGRLSFTVDQTVTKGLCYLTDAVKTGSFTVRGAYGEYTLQTVSAKTKIRFSGSPGGIRAEIRVKSVCDVTEFLSPDAAPLEEAQARDAEDAGRAALETLAQSSFDVLYYGKRADICRLARRAALRFPGKENAFREEAFSRKAGNIKITVHLTVRRTGKESL